MTSPLTISLVTEPSRELYSAIVRLTTELSSSAPPLSYDELTSLITHDATDLFVAESGQEVIGMLTLATFPLPTGIRAWIEDVVVSKDARGTGAGSMLVRRAVDQAAEHGARTVDLTSRPSRTAANRLYQRLGFERRETNVYRMSPRTH
ncbi:GNAT family N-acetyltransferase [Flexivirga oryzae]|uniref:Ribosomal protein S18 acetylase RimI-like enzyme n=1 Tax=Flexivirga oryzae TaxID=1794944 RepID=A0A839MZ45_9MICO|nr:GNAT family N-acetyltransferase [Flexivirga oryzae]MBB2890730.1 ribosomal protein S18 acetylase RimI-like enzyme [Flexivirga oryzae]